jgi:hypothetical protein
MHHLVSGGNRVALIAMVALGCARSPVVAPAELPGPSRDASAVVTDTTVYRLHDTGGVLLARAFAVYVNRTSERVYFDRCMPADAFPTYSFRRTGADSLKVAEFGPAWACVGGVSPGIVEPGATLSFQLQLYARADYNGQPPPNPVARVGLFRAELPFYRCAAGGTWAQGCTLLVQPDRQTNAFDVRF